MGIDAWVVCLDCGARELLNRHRIMLEDPPHEDAAKVVAFVFAHPGHRIAIFSDHELTDREGDKYLGTEPYVPPKRP